MLLKLFSCKKSYNFFVIIALDKRTENRENPFLVSFTWKITLEKRAIQKNMKISFSYQ